LTAATAEIHSVLSAGAKIVVAELLLHARVIVPHALTVLRSVLPIVSRPIDIDWPVDSDVVVSPVASSAPVVTA